ncbi:MAG TPA: GlsB/YeaQ/YmgE family stress response membrane protein [Gemmataceae bacterium]|nr:GlsB/YeaQ/YmgE family stress response membrane protein [Gemmataceae bacterium]
MTASNREESRNVGAGLGSLGLIAGFIGSKIVNRSGQGFLLDIVLGIVGAVLGGFLFTALGATGITGFNLYSMFVAIVGAVVVLWAYHAISGRST